MGFTGFPPEATEFLQRLELDNTKVFWDANRSTYERCVRAPMEALCDSVDARFQPLRLFRPYRDVRFSKNKAPYKTTCGAVGERQGGALYYVHLSPSGLFAASGYYMMARDQLERFRAAVDADAGADLEAILGRLRGYDRGGESLKTAPRGCPRDHPRIELLRLKGLTVNKELGSGAWLHSAQARRKVQDVWKAADEVNDWLDTYVGPSQLPPDDAR